MPPSITACIPILGRPTRIHAAARRFTHPLVDLLFLPDETDHESVNVLDAAGLPYAFAPPAPAFGVPTFASKVNHAYRITSTPFLLYTGDDVAPERGWVERALITLEDARIGLLATNDHHHHLVRRGLLATHGIIRRTYVEEHGTASLPDAGPIFFEGYRHWCCDVEVSFVARQRGAFAYDRRVVLRHNHPANHRASSDATYELGRSFADADRALRDARIPTWPN